MYYDVQPILNKVMEQIDSHKVGEGQYARWLWQDAEEWLSKTPIRHIKNRFPTETKYGCERYAYFDKYMTTVASNLWAAYTICDDSGALEASPDLG